MPEFDHALLDASDAELLEALYQLNLEVFSQNNEKWICHDRPHYLKFDIEMMALAPQVTTIVYYVDGQLWAFMAVSNEQDEVNGPGVTLAGFSKGFDPNRTGTHPVGIEWAKYQFNTARSYLPVGTVLVAPNRNPESVPIYEVAGVETPNVPKDSDA